MSPSIRGLAHTAFNVRDFDVAIDFYCGKLGLEQAFEVLVPDSFAGTDHPLAALVGEVGIVYLRVGNRAFLELFRPLPGVGPPDARSNFDHGFSHICLEIDGLHDFVRGLRVKGVVVDRDVTLGDDGSYQAWIRDPDGNRIELMEYTSESLQVPHF